MSQVIKILSQDIIATREMKIDNIIEEELSEEVSKIVMGMLEAVEIELGLNFDIDKKNGYIEANELLQDKILGMVTELEFFDPSAENNGSKTLELMISKDGNDTSSGSIIPVDKLDEVVEIFNIYFKSLRGYAGIVKEEA